MVYTFALLRSEVEEQEVRWQETDAKGKTVEKKKKEKVMKGPVLEGVRVVFLGANQEAPDAEQLVILIGPAETLKALQNDPSIQFLNLASARAIASSWGLADPAPFAPKGIPALE